MSLDELMSLAPTLQICAGEVLIYHDGRHISLGRIGASGLVLTEDGDAFVAELQAPAQASAEAELAAAIADVADPKTIEPKTIERVISDQATLKDLLG